MFLLALAVTAFGYYTAWTLLTPFFPPSSPVHAWFPSREYAVLVPSLLLLVGLCTVGMFAGVVYIRAARKEKAKALSNKGGKSE